MAGQEDILSIDTGQLKPAHPDTVVTPEDLQVVQPATSLFDGISSEQAPIKKDTKPDLSNLIGIGPIIPKTE